MDPNTNQPSADALEERRLLNWTGVGVFMFVLAAILPFGGRAIYQRYHVYRAEQVAAAAMALIADERWEAASQVLQQDFKTYGKDPPVLRAIGTLFLDGYDDPVMAANILRQVLASGKGTPDDIVKLANAVLKMGDTPEAQRLFGTIPEEVQRKRMGMELLASIQLKSGQKDLAEKTLRRALSLEPDDPRSQFRLALLDEASSFEVSKTVASQSVWNVARRNDSLALEAVAHLCTSPSLTAVQAQELLTLVEQNPKAAPRDRYRVLSAMVRLRPLDRDKVIAVEVDRNRGVATDKLFDFLRWLGAQKQYERIIGLVHVGTALHDPDVFLVYVDALSAAERWKELLDLAQEPKVPVSDAARHFIIAECTSHLKPDLVETTQHIEKVYSFASPADQQIIVKAAALAETKGLNELAIVGYSKVAEARPNLRVSMLEKVMELNHRERNSAAVVATLKRLCDLRPGNQGYRDYLNYLRLVMGNEIEVACDTVSVLETAAKVSESALVPQALLRALVALRMGDKAKTEVEAKAINPSIRLAPGQRAVLAGLVAYTGDDVAAFRMVESVPRALLLPEEMEFLRRVFKDSTIR